MADKYYPPIPGVAGNRGRPSREEMAKRKAYWDKLGGPPGSAQKEESKTQFAGTPKPSATTSTISKLLEVAGKLVSTPTPTVPPKGATPSVKISFKDNVPEDIQKLIESSPVPFNRDDKKTIDEIFKTLPPPKRGRPSAEAIAARQDAKEKINSLIVNKIKAAGGIINVPVEVPAVTNPVATSEVESETTSIAAPLPPVLMVGIQQYKFGDQVIAASYSREELRARKKPRRSMGVIQRHDIGNRFAYVHWNGGVKDWADVTALKPFLASREELEEIIAEPKDDDDSDTE
jgi:hypothetical protein